MNQLTNFYLFSHLLFVFVRNTSLMVCTRMPATWPSRLPAWVCRRRKSSRFYRARSVSKLPARKPRKPRARVSPVSGDPDSKVHGPTWGPSGAGRTQVGPMLAPWTLLSGELQVQIAIWHWWSHAGVVTSQINGMPAVCSTACSV